MTKTKSELFNEILEIYKHYNHKYLYFYDVESCQIFKVNKKEFDDFRKNNSPFEVCTDKKERFYQQLTVKRNLIPIPFPINENTLRKEYHSHIDEFKKKTFEDFKLMSYHLYLNTWFDSLNIFEVPAKNYILKEMFCLLKDIYDENVFSLFNSTNLIEIKSNGESIYYIVDKLNKQILFSGDQTAHSLINCIKSKDEKIDMDLLVILSKYNCVSFVEERFARKTSVDLFAKFEDEFLDFDEYIPCITSSLPGIKYVDYVREINGALICSALDLFLQFIHAVKATDVEIHRNEHFTFDLKKIGVKKFHESRQISCYFDLTSLFFESKNFVSNKNQNIKIEIKKVDEQNLRNGTRNVYTFEISIFDLNEKEQIFAKKIKYSNHFISDFNDIFIDYFKKYGVAKNITVNSLLGYFVASSAGYKKSKINFISKDSSKDEDIVFDA